MSNSQTSLATDKLDTEGDLEGLQRIFKKRRSVRAYFSEKPNREDIMEILGSVRYAPNSCNLQHYGFIYIDDDVFLKKLAVVATRKVLWGPALIVIIDDKRFSQKRRAGLQSVAAAAENIILAATAKGLGTCWMAGFGGDKDIRESLQIPEYYEVTGLMVIGYPAPEMLVGSAQRLELADYIHINRFETKKAELLSDLNVDHWPMDKLVSYRERVGSVYAPRKRIQLYHKAMIENCADLYLELQEEHKKAISADGNSAIDIASYDGCFLREIFKRENASRGNTKVFAADYSRYFLDILKEQCPETGDIEMGMDHALKTPEIYEFMSLVFKIEFLPDTEQLLKALRSSCSDNGRLFLTSVPAFSPRAMMYKAHAFVNRSNMYERNRLYRFGPYRHLSASDIEEHVRNAGWVIEKSGDAGKWPRNYFKWWWLSPGT